MYEQMRYAICFAGVSLWLHSQMTFVMPQTQTLCGSLLGGIQERPRMSKREVSDMCSFGIRGAGNPDLFLPLSEPKPAPVQKEGSGSPEKHR